MKDIVVEGVEPIYEKGGQTTLVVKSTTEGVDVASVSFKSDNEQVATVDETGKVTGVNKGTAKITVTAKDANGTEIVKDVTIEVKPASNATVKLDVKEQVMYVGTELTLKATVENNDNNDEIVWTSSDEKVATVDKNGLVKAIASGAAIITVKVGATTATDVCSINVMDYASGIETFNMIHSNVLEVKLAGPVADADKKVTPVLKTGSGKQDVEVKWAEDNASFTLTKKSAFAKAEYTVTLESETIKFAPEKSSKVLVVDDKMIPALSSIAIDTKAALLDDTVVVKYTTYDQYGDKFTAVNLSDFVWNVTCSDSTKRFDSAALDSTTKYGELSINMLAAKGVNGLVLDDITKFTPDKDSLLINVYNPKATGVTTQSTVDLKSLAIKNVTINGIDGEVKEFYQTNKAQTITLNISGVDSQDQTVDFKKIAKYSNGAAGKNFFSSNNADFVISKINDKGQLEVDVTADKSGEATISAQGADGKVATFKLEVKASPYAVKFEFADNADFAVIAGDNTQETAGITYIPVKSITDQYGNAMDISKVDLDDPSAVNKFSFSISTTTNVTIASAGYVMGKGLAIKTNNSDTTKGTATITAVSVKGNVTKSFEVLDGRAPSTLKITKAPNTTLVAGKPAVAGSNTTVEFDILDQFGKEIKLTKDYKVVIEGCDTTTGNTYLKSDKTTIVNAASDSSKGAVTITANSAVTTTDQEISIKLMNDSKQIGDPITYKFTVNQNAVSFDMKADKTSYVAGQPIVLTITAKDTNDKVITTYNDTKENIKFTETTSLAAEKGTIGNQTSFQDVKFVNGVATVTLTAKAASDATTKNVYSVNIPTAVTGVTVDNSTVNNIEVKPADAVAFAINAKDDKLYIKDSIGNRVMFTGNIKIKNKDIISGVESDSDNYVVISFADGVSTTTMTVADVVGSIKSADGKISYEKKN